MPRLTHTGRNSSMPRPGDILKISCNGSFLLPRICTEVDMRISTTTRRATPVWVVAACLCHTYTTNHSTVSSAAFVYLCSTGCMHTNNTYSIRVYCPSRVAGCHGLLTANCSLSGYKLRWFLMKVPRPRGLQLLLLMYPPQIYPGYQQS